MPWSIGDTYQRSVTVAGVKLVVRWEVTAIADPSPDDDPNGPGPTDGIPIDFAIVDRRTPEQVGTFSHMWNENQLDVVSQFISADPDAPTFHPITVPMRPFFGFAEGVSVGSRRRGVS